jgi:hypothetical protein
MTYARGAMSMSVGAKRFSASSSRHHITGSQAQLVAYSLSLWGAIKMRRNWGSMNSYYPLCVSCKTLEQGVTKTRGVTVRPSVQTPSRQKHKSQASQAGIGLLKSSESAGRSPVDAPRTV